jgi:putative NADPH-quinone reductase
MPKNILVLQGHPDPDTAHFGYALAEAYTEGARQAGHEIRSVSLAQLDFPMLRSKHDWEKGSVPPALQPVQDTIRWADHLVLFFPLWLGGMPALTKGFLEQALRPGFALGLPGSTGLPKKLLAGKSARVVVTMGMPALVYRWYFRAHSLKALERNILGFVGIAPIHETLVGLVEGMKDEQRQAWLGKLRALGAKAA